MSLLRFNNLKICNIALNLLEILIYLKLDIIKLLLIV
jgi:hypothetical protein